MDEQIILAVDDNGKFSGEYIPKMVGHRGEGKRHLAITVLLYNSKGEVLLQKRKHKVFDKTWDFTGSTHPLHLPSGKDETLEEATLRCLKVEYGIGEKVPLKNFGFFNYFARYGDLCENEHCAMMVGIYSGEINVNPEVAYDIKWLPKQKFLEDIKKNPENYCPWVLEGVKVLGRAGFFK